MVWFAHCRAGAVARPEDVCGPQGPVYKNPKKNRKKSKKKQKKLSEGKKWIFFFKNIFVIAAYCRAADNCAGIPTAFPGARTGPHSKTLTYVAAPLTFS